MTKKHTILPYNHALTDLAGNLRKNMTLSVVLLWKELKNRQMLGFDFERQRPMSNSIVDFYCIEPSLPIEIDGNIHFNRDEEDDKRQGELENMGVRFLRFEDSEVKKNMANVLRVIADWIEK